MALNDIYLYSKNHLIPVFGKNGLGQERHLSVTISDNGERIQIKLRDLTEYLFNYTRNIDRTTFEDIRLDQSLDINYTEFKTNVTEMFQQFQRREIFLKCEVSDKTCIMIFYTKSKIKNIVYLTLELHTTDQYEIISEMYKEINETQETNKRLQSHLSKMKQYIQQKELEVEDLTLTKKTMFQKFLNNLRQIEDIFTSKINFIQDKVLSSLLSFNNQIEMMENNILVLKQANELKKNSNDLLIKTMDNMRVEITEKDLTIDRIKKENTSLNILRVNLEKNVADLKNSVEEIGSIKKKLDAKNSELQSDLQKLSIVVIEKDGKIDELSKDLVQANNMLIGFNRRYDSKSQQVEQLQSQFSSIEKSLMDEKLRVNEIQKSFNEYKSNFNIDKFESIKNDLALANQSNGELQEEIRRLHKMNTLLSQRVGYLNPK